MKQYFIDNNSDKLLLFFAGWGCDEYEFKHLACNDDLLIFYDYSDLSFDFDFSGYKEINLLAFSAGVFIASIMNLDIKINKKLALSGNPYLFDKKYGLSDDIIMVFRNINEDNCNDFVRNYIVKTDEEFKSFQPAMRTIESCNKELDCLKEIYTKNYSKIKDIYDNVLFGDEDPIFNVQSQLKFYGNKIKTIRNARHNLFFRIHNYEELYNIAKHT